MNKSESLKKRWRDGTFTGTTGIPATEQRKIRTSIALKGRMPKNIILINANKKGSGNPMWGKKISKEHKILIKNAALNRWSELKNDPIKFSEYRNRLSKKQKGSNGSNWKGGITPENKRVRRGIEFRLWREAVFTRDNWTCQKYGIRGGKLHPHHIQNFSDHKELRFSIDNGVTLSDKAHREFHHIYGTKNNTKEQLEEFLKK